MGEDHSMGTDIKGICSLKVHQQRGRPADGVGTADRVTVEVPGVRPEVRPVRPVAGVEVPWML